MNNRPEFFSLSREEWSSSSYDLAIFALGFESRATYLLESVAERTKRGLALGFNYGKEISYESNLSKFSLARFNVKEDLLDQEFEGTIKGRLYELDKNQRQQIFIDISCFTRFRLAAIVNQIFLHSHTTKRELTIDFAYSLARFERPTASRYPNTVVGPAHSAFAGWSQGGYSSTAAVLGLGYEQDQALGVVEFLQAGEVWAFSPNSPIKEYKSAVSKANSLLLSEMNDGRVLEYDVCSPVSTLSRLESVIRGLDDSHSVVLVPFGPKIFVLCALIIAAQKRDIAVWRVSQESGIKPCDRISSEVDVGLRLVFSPSS